MPRSKCRKTRAPVNTENLKLAVEDVLQRKLSLKVAAQNNSVSKSSQFIFKVDFSQYNVC